MSMPKHALVLFSYRSHKMGYIELLFSRLSKVAEGHGLQLERGSLKDLHIEIKNNHLLVKESLTRKKLTDFDVIYFELWYKSQQQALAAALYADRTDTPFFSHELLSIMPITKIGELARMADNGITLPQTFTSSAREIRKVFKREQPFAYPFIMKAADGYGGKNNFLIHSYKELVRELDGHKDLSFVLQEFIPNNHDYRCIVLGGEIKLVLQRTRAKNAKTHLNNTSQGAEGKMIPVSELPIDAQQQVLRAANVLGRSQFAGVDLMINSETRTPYILEVNQTPQIEIGAEIDKKMAAMVDYIKSLAKE